MFCYHEGLFSFRHSWKDSGVVLEDVFLVFRRPIGKATMRYCERCGEVKLMGLNEPLRKKSKGGSKA